MVTSVPPVVERGSLPHAAYTRFRFSIERSDRERSAKSVLLEYVDHPDWRVRVTCVTGLSQYSSNPPPHVVEALTQSLDDENKYVSLHAAITLVRCEVFTEPALTKLIEAVNDDSIPPVLRTEPISQLGYGVVVNAGINDVTVDYNRFNYNRHGIANNGAGYTARYNYFGPKGIAYALGTHPGGIEKIVIHHNTVAFEEQINKIENDESDPIGPNISIRGIPDDVAHIHHNWLYNPNPPTDTPRGYGDQAIIQAMDEDGDVHTGEWRHVEFKDNHYGSDPPDDCDIGAPRKGCP
jgi:hypothetical protein